MSHSEREIGRIVERQRVMPRELKFCTKDEMFTGRFDDDRQASHHFQSGVDLLAGKPMGTLCTKKPALKLPSKECGHQSTPHRDAVENVRSAPLTFVGQKPMNGDRGVEDQAHTGSSACIS